jgi:hypothetical protein
MMISEKTKICSDETLEIFVLSLSTSHDASSKYNVHLSSTCFVRRRHWLRAK